MKILFIQSGGTIDKDYPHMTKGWAFEIDDPASERILAILNPSFDYEIVSACKKDSLELDDKDRLAIAELIDSNSADAYIITHGTDTMIETGQFLATRLMNKKVIITGAMRPERFSNSDAEVNLGTALGAINFVENGVYLAMHGIVKQWDKIRRNKETGQYY